MFFGKINLSKTDWLIIGSIILFLGTHFVTTLVISELVATLPQRAEAIIEAVEASPVARMTLQLGQYEFVLRFILVPAVIGGFYYGIKRRKFANTNDQQFTLGSIAMTFFLAALINFMNDLAVLVAVI